MAAVVRMISHHMKLFLSPPTATELYQALDRVFQDFHKSYRALKLALQGRRLANHKDATMTRDLAVEVIGHVILDGWASKERLQKAWEQVGITLTGLDKFRIRELDLLPERPLKGAIVEHNPALSAADLNLEQMKDAFMQGPSKIESPPKRKGRPGCSTAAGAVTISRRPLCIYNSHQLRPVMLACFRTDRRSWCWARSLRCCLLL